MKILITESNAVVSFGKFVHAEKGQTIVDTDELTVKQIIEIASANNATITARKKAEIVAQLEAILAITNTEVTKMSDQEKYEVIVVEGFTAELTDNEIKRQLFDAGADFDDLKKLFKTIV